MTLYACLTIVDWCANYLAHKLKRSFKCLWGCSWQAIWAISEISNPFFLKKGFLLVIFFWLHLHKVLCSNMGEILQGSSWRAVPAISGGSKPWEWRSMPSHDKVYTLDSCWLVHNLLTSNIRRILHASWRMQLTSCSNIPWELWTIWMTYHALL